MEIGRAYSWHNEQVLPLMVNWHVMHKRHPTHLASNLLGFRESPLVLLILGDGFFHSFDMARNPCSRSNLQLCFSI